jgi:hypothetical protein
MGMDGLSIANTGAVKEPTSAELATRTEQAVAADPKNSTQQVQGSSAKHRVKEKEEEEGSGVKNAGGGGKNDTFEDGLVETPPEEEHVSEIDIEDIENPNKEFYVKLNVKDDIIELYDSSSDRLVETIPGTELAELVKKLNMASGIFVNKKV